MFTEQLRKYRQLIAFQFVTKLVMQHIYTFLAILATFNGFGQQIIDSCFSTSTPSTGFPPSANLVSFDADLCQWNGSAWVGGWSGANLTLPPPAGGQGCRVIWCGNGNSWTTGGEGFAVQLNAPLVAGQTYTFNFTTVSHGFGSNANFSPAVYTNSTAMYPGTLVGNLTPAGTSWVTNPFTFTATAAQAGHTWLIIHSGATGSSGFVNNLCVGCNVPSTTCSVNLGPDQNLCAGQTVTLNATTPGANYQWQNGSTAPTFNVTQAGTYSVTINVNGCTATDAVTVNFGSAPVLNLGPDLTLCTGQSQVLNATTPGASYLWQNGSTSPTFTVTQAGNYSVTVTNNCGSATDAVQAIYNAPPVLNLGPDLVLCNGQTQLLNATDPGASYLWQDGSTSPTFNVTLAGDFSVTLTNNCGSVTDAITVTYVGSPLVDLGPDLTICQGETVTLDASFPGANYTWQDGATTSTYNVSLPGSYTVNVTNSCGTATDNLSVLVNPSPDVDLGNDASFCAGETLLLDATVPGGNYLWQDNSTGATLLVNQTGTYSVTVESQGCEASDQISVTVNPIPNVNAGNDLSLCEGSMATLTGTGAASYTWNNGVSNGVAFFPPAGTTVYTVTGTSAFGCTDTDDITITTGSSPQISFTADINSGCTPLTVNFTNTTEGTTSCVWTLSDGTTISGCGTVQAVFEEGGCYDVTLTTEFSSGCFSSLTQENMICAEAPPIASFLPIPQQVTSWSTEVSFMNTSVGGESYTWYFQDGSAPSNEVEPTHQFPLGEAGSYWITLVAESPLGCLDTAVNYVEVLEELIYYVPNSFTPDGDIVNQAFKPVFTSGFDPYNYNLKIFNRWGELIFESNDPNYGWDGSYSNGDTIYTCQQGTYIWKIEFKSRDNDEKQFITGHVNLLR